MTVRAPDMSRAVVGIVVLILFIAPGAVCAQAPDAERTVREFLVPFANRDFDRFIPYFAEDATMFFPPATTAPTGLVRGRAQIEQAFKTLYTAYPRKPGTVPNPITPKDLLVQQSGEHAIVTLLLGNETAPGRRTIVLRRVADQWKIVHLHGSSANNNPP